MSKKSKSWSDLGKVKFAPSCYESHPMLEVGPGLKIHGASCLHPKHGFDWYIGFDRGIAETPKAYPWTPGGEFLFYIKDHGVPTSVADFKELVSWTLAALLRGETVHAGCIGGHGRTGLFLSALVYAATGNTEAIKYVRENYCDRAVESQEQVDFLVDHFAQKTVAPTHKPLPPLNGTGGFTDPLDFTSGSYSYSAGVPKKKGKGSILAILKKGSIWGKHSAHVTKHK